MQNVPVAAAPVSPSKQKGGDHFSVLGAPRRFAQDLKALERRFYELSRECHPDRFAALGKAGAEAQRLSLEQMSVLNEAYRVLKNRESLREYLLEQEGLMPSRDQQQGALPLQIAEAWFELQDLLMEDPEAAHARLAGFESELAQAVTTEESAIAELEANYDQAPSRDPLEKIAARARTLSYLRSLGRDVARIKERFTI